ncbi:hypothetical protein RZ760_004280 [Providencia rettgeri]|nr:hypothetical protein [Providencia rettgeri]MDV5225170.1 hypothetical protein [Providencia rettgeri]
MALGGAGYRTCQQHDVLSERLPTTPPLALGSAPMLPSGASRPPILW